MIVQSLVTAFTIAFLATAMFGHVLLLCAVFVPGRGNPTSPTFVALRLVSLVFFDAVVHPDQPDPVSSNAVGWQFRWQFSLA